MPVEEVRKLLADILAARGFSAERAAACAALFVEATLDGVYTHGLERFQRFVMFVEKGWVKAEARPRLVAAAGAIERWDGQYGPGNLNALAMADRAVELARQHGLGCVALARTNHWMRGGQYGLRIAEAGLAAICWTNTTKNLPIWGSRESLLGNNPLIIALPREAGPILLDMAMSLFSFGKLELASKRGDLLSVEGGWDEEGRLSRDPAAILKTRRVVQTGLWKGSGLSLVLDLLGVMLSGGDSVGEVGRREAEYGLTQIFLALDPAKLSSRDELEAAVAEMEGRVHGARPDEGFGAVRFPGESRLATRQRNLELGLPMRRTLRDELLALPGAEPR